VSVKHQNQRQLAERWDVSEATLERWRSEGLGPLYLKLQGRVLYRIEDIEGFEAQCLHKSTSARVAPGTLTGGVA
jgi:predicted site-specific integrase-resolvase